MFFPFLEPFFLFLFATCEQKIMNKNIKKRSFCKKKLPIMPNKAGYLEKFFLTSLRCNCRRKQLGYSFYHKAVFSFYAIFNSDSRWIDRNIFHRVQFVLHKRRCSALNLYRCTLEEYLWPVFGSIAERIHFFTKKKNYPVIVAFVIYIQFGRYS